MLAGGALLRAFADSDADYGLTECGTCKMQMEFGGRKKVIHPIKVLAASYELKVSGTNGGALRRLVPHYWPQNKDFCC